MSAMVSEIISLTIVYSTVQLTGEFPAQMAIDAENVSIWWRRHDIIYIYTCLSRSKHNVHTEPLLKQLELLKLSDLLKLSAFKYLFGSVPRFI